VRAEEAMEADVLKLVGIAIPPGDVVVAATEPLVGAADETSLAQLDRIAQLDLRVMAALAVRRVRVPRGVGNWFSTQHRASLLWTDTVEVDGDGGGAVKRSATCLVVTSALARRFAPVTPEGVAADLDLFARHRPFFYALLDAVLEAQREDTLKPGPGSAEIATATAAASSPLSPPLPELDDAVLVRVMGFLDGAGVYHAARVCKRWAVIATSSALQIRRRFPDPVVSFSAFPASR
jgi:hypothetical protein